MTDTYSWIGSSGAFWDTASDWTDLVARTSQTVGWPTGTASAIVNGPPSGSFETISGPGSALNLATTGSIALAGNFIVAGTLSAGDNQAKDQNGATLQFGNSTTVTAATFLLNNGTVEVSGTGASLVATSATIGQPAGYVIPSSGSYFQYAAGVTGTLDIQPYATLTAGTLAVINGSVLANGRETLGSLDLGIALSNPDTTGAYYFQTDGHLIVASGTMAITGNATVAAGEIAVNGGSLTIGGTVALQGQAIDGGGLYVDEGGTAKIAALTIAPTGQATGGQAIVAVDSLSALGIGATGPVKSGTVAIAAGLVVPVAFSTTVQAPAIVNSGTVVVSAGTLSIQGTLSGTGTIDTGPSVLLQLDAPVLGGTIVMTGTGGTLEIAAAVAPAIHGFVVGDTLVFDQTAATAATFTAGTLSVLNGTSVAAAIALANVYPGATFASLESAEDQAIVTMLTPGTAPPSPNTDIYVWNGAAGTSWNNPANWTDQTTGTPSPSYQPGTLTPASIAGTTIGSPRIITAGGTAASLSITAQVELLGTYAIAGALSDGAGGLAGTLTAGPSASIVANTLSLSQGSVLQVATNASFGIGTTGPVANGTLAIGPHTTVSASGTLEAPAISNLGTIVVPAGSLAIAGALSGGGTIQIGAGATAALGSDPGPILLAGTDSVLEITAGGSVSGTVYGYAPGDRIAFDGVTANTATITANGTLVLDYGTTTVATIALAGTYTQASLSVAQSSSLTLESVSLTTTPGVGTSVTLLFNPPPGTSQWTGSAPGDFANAAEWTGQQVPGANLQALIDSLGQPIVLYDTGSHTVQALTNALGDFDMAGGTLSTDTLTNDSVMNWAGGTLAAIAFTNAGALLIVPDGQTLTGTALTNTGGIVVAGASGAVTIHDDVGNSGTIDVVQGTLCLASGGTSSGSGLAGAGLLEFTGGTFAVSGGEFLAANLAVVGGLLDLAALTHASTIALTSGTLAATAPLSVNDFTQSGGTLVGALIAANATLTGGSETAPGATMLTGNSRIAGTTAIDGGHTLANTNTLTWSAGDIALNDGTLVNAGWFEILGTGGMIGSGLFVNTGTAIVATAGDLRIDATLTSSGTIVLQSGTLCVDGGGGMSGQLRAAPGTMLQIDPSTVPFAVSSAGYSAANTWVNGGTLDLSATPSITFVQSLTTTAGLLGLGSRAAADYGTLFQTGGTISGSGILTVQGDATIAGGVETGPGMTTLQGDSTIDGLTFTGGRILDSTGELEWARGNIVLGTGTIRNDGTCIVTASGTILGSGSVVNNGRMVIAAAGGQASIDVPLINTGTILVDTGTLAIDQIVGGAGTIILNGPGMVSLAGSVSGTEHLRFLNPGGTLATSGTGLLAAPIAGFGVLDTLDATAIPYSVDDAIAFRNATLTLTGTAGSAAFILVGDYTRGDFHILDDNHGGTSVIYIPT